MCGTCFHSAVAGSSKLARTENGHGHFDELQTHGQGVVAGCGCEFAMRADGGAADGGGCKGEAGCAVKQIQGDERVLHALNRFTFGPRPGDVAAVRTMGLQRWFEQQLNPTSIDDSALEERLAAFPAMKMQQAELMERYPGPQVLRQIIAKNL